MSLCRIEKKHTYTLHEVRINLFKFIKLSSSISLQFTDSQHTTLNDVSARLQEFRDLVKDVVASACRTRLFEAGFVPDDFIHSNDSANGTFFFTRVKNHHFRFF
jgi:dynein heavy chain